MGPNMQIEIKGIAKKYGKKEVLRDISFSAESGKCIGILGSNGCGKSTLLSILAGIQPTDCGEFLVSDKARFITGQTYVCDGGRTLSMKGTD